MASYEDAKAAMDAVFESVDKLGVEILTVRPKEIEDGWTVAVETAMPLRKEDADDLSSQFNVPISLTASGGEMARQHS